MGTALGLVGLGLVAAILLPAAWAAFHTPRDPQRIDTICWERPGKARHD